MTKKELLERAKELNIPGRWDMNKQQLEEAIKKAEANKNENGIEDQNKMEYVKKAPYGTLVAFKVDGENKPINTAKIIKRDLDKKVLNAETQYGKKYEVKFEDVVWVKTGKSWPRFIYEILKGKQNENN